MEALWDAKKSPSGIQHTRRRSALLDVRVYNSGAHLIENLEDKIIRPALEKHNELVVWKNAKLRIRSIDEF